MSSTPLSRREFLQVLAAGTAASLVTPAASSHRSIPRGWPLRNRVSTLPNILVIMVDQLRTPQWFPDPITLDGYLPQMARLRTGAVSFGQHYTAANACTPSRGALLTGLYAHQTACLLTWPNVPPDLQVGFPTWGTALRNLGYQTYWYGKWHLSHSCNLSPYGFSGGTCPSPNGSPGQGLAKDPQIVDQFTNWLQRYGSVSPWCTTVSLVNPHDIAWYYTGSDTIPGEQNPPSVFTALPPNFETPSGLKHENKPSLQTAFQKATGNGMGTLAFRGGGYEQGWLKLLDLYLLLQQYVDTQIGRVLDALESHPDISQNTIIVFTSDHGEYAGSHGLRGKACAVYDEGIRVPLYVKDPTGQWTASTDVERTQLTSSVDFMPMLLTFATGSDAWRSDPNYAHLASRLDLTSILLDPNAAGRSYVLNTSDEDWIEGFLHGNFADHVASHVIGYRTSTAKLGVYSYWNGYDIRQDSQEVECYDYSTDAGQKETDNVAQSQPDLYNQLYDALWNDAIPNELRQPLPASLQSIQQSAIDAYLAFEGG